MLSGTYRMSTNAKPETVWSVLLDSMENPQKYIPDVGVTKVLERLAGEPSMSSGSEARSTRGGFNFFVFN